MLVTRENYGAGRCALLILFAVYYTSIFSTYYYSQHEGTPSAMLVLLAGCTGYPQKCEIYYDSIRQNHIFVNSRRHKVILRSGPLLSRLFQ